MQNVQQRLDNDDRLYLGWDWEWNGFGKRAKLLAIVELRFNHTVSCRKFRPRQHEISVKKNNKNMHKHYLSSVDSMFFRTHFSLVDRNRIGLFRHIFPVDFGSTRLSRNRAARLDYNLVLSLSKLECIDWELQFHFSIDTQKCFQTLAMSMDKKLIQTMNYTNNLPQSLKDKKYLATFKKNFFKLILLVNIVFSYLYFHFHKSHTDPECIFMLSYLSVKIRAA